MRRQGILASQRFSAAAPQPTDAYRYHRFRYDGVNGAFGDTNGYIAFTELQVFETADGPDVAPLSMPTASEQNSDGQGVGNLFDGNAQTFYASQPFARSGARTVTITLDFKASPRKFHHMVIHGREAYGGDSPSIANQSPGAWYWEVSNDGTNWMIVAHPTSEANWQPGELRTYYASRLLTFFRLAQGSSQGNDQFAGYSELAFRAGGAIVTPKRVLSYPSTFYNESYSVRKLFDGDGYSDWLTQQGLGTNPSAVTVAFLTSQVADLDSFDITARMTYNFSTPNGFQLLKAIGDDADSLFVAVAKANFQGFPPFGSGETRTFAVGAGT